MWLDSEKRKGKVASWKYERCYHLVVNGKKIAESSKARSSWWNRSPTMAEAGSTASPAALR